MASLLRNGKVGKKDLQKASELAEKSDSMGCPFGTYECAVLCEDNNKNKADSLYKKAFPKLLELAESGDYMAQSRLYLIFAFGFGAEKNSKKAIEWAQKAASHGYAPAQKNLGGVYLNGDLGVEKNPKLGLEWIKKAADQGYDQAQAIIGAAYLNGGLGVEKNPKLGLEWLQKAADQGCDPAQEVVVGAYLGNFPGIDADPQKAFEWLQKAATQGNDRCSLLLGVLYGAGEFKGIKVSKDLKMAYSYLKKANNSKNPEISDEASKLIKKIELEPEIIQIKNADTRDEIVQSVADPESEKYGGPDTATVIKFATGQGQDNNYANMMSGLTAQLGQATGVKYKEIKRGATLKSLGPTIPVNTILFPIRIVMQIQNMDQTVDYYFYKDEFGDWKASLK